MTSRRRARLVLAVLLAAIEGAAWLADWHWQYRQRLLEAYQSARNESADTWPNAAEFWNLDAHPDNEPLQMRTEQDRSLTPESAPPGRRVFILGESAAYGQNVDYPQTFAGRLARQLEPAGTHVLNVARPGASPQEVMEQARVVLHRYRPSTLVLYTGNNQWQAIGSPVDGGHWSPLLVRVLTVLAYSRALALVENVVINWSLRHREALTGNFQDSMDLHGSSYALAHPLDDMGLADPTVLIRARALALQRFEDSLVQIVEHAQAAGVGVVLSTVPYAPRISPAWKIPQFESFDRTHAPDVRRLLHEAARQKDAGDCASSLRSIDSALKLDPLPPLLHFVKGQCLERLGDFDGATAAYEQSRENWIGSNSSRISVNRIVRNVAARFNLPLVDAVKAFDDFEHQHGTHFNEDLIFDECHPTALGHEVIAEAMTPFVH